MSGVRRKCEAAVLRPLHSAERRRLYRIALLWATMSAALSALLPAQIAWSEGLAAAGLWLAVATFASTVSIPPIFALGRRYGLMPVFLLAQLPFMLALLAMPALALPTLWLAPFKSLADQAFWAWYHVELSRLTRDGGRGAAVAFGANLNQIAAAVTTALLGLVLHTVWTWPVVAALMAAGLAIFYASNRHAGAPQIARAAPLSLRVTIPRAFGLLLFGFIAVTGGEAWAAVAALSLGGTIAVGGMLAGVALLAGLLGGTVAGIVADRERARSVRYGSGVLACSWLPWILFPAAPAAMLLSRLLMVPGGRMLGVGFDAATYDHADADPLTSLLAREFWINLGRAMSALFFLMAGADPEAWIAALSILGPAACILFFLWAEGLTHSLARVARVNSAG